MARIGFYGGTFNPIHMGHVEVCRQAIKQLRLDCLHVIPTFIPPHKATPDLAAGEDRLEMCRLAVRELQGAIADDYELTCGGVSYPTTGSDGDGYALAKQAGHRLFAPRASLCAMTTSDGWTGKWAGLTLKNVTLHAKRGSSSAYRCSRYAMISSLP